MSSQEEVITIKMAKNIEEVNGKIFTIGSTSKKIGGLNEEEVKEMRDFGIEIIKKGGFQEENSEVIRACLEDEDFQKELGLESQYVPELWYIKREFDIARYFSTRKEIMDDILELMVETMHEGIKDPFKEGKVYKNDLTIKEVKDFIKNFDELKKELGI